MRTHEIREMSGDDINARITDTRREIVTLRFQLAARKLESPAKLREAKKDLARLLTIQAQKSKVAAATK